MVKYKKKVYKRICPICKKPFETTHPYKIVCLWPCRKEKARRNSLRISRIKRRKKSYPPCEVCGFSETSDLHHEEEKDYILCPNHHALVTRGIKTISQLFDSS